MNDSWFRPVLIAGVAVVFLAARAVPESRNVQAAQAGSQVSALTITILSTSLADEGFGEWGFAALVQSTGERSSTCRA